MLILLALPSAAPLPLAPLCAAPQDVPGLGLACPVAGGWSVRLPDGTTVTTHGPDPLPLGADPAAALPPVPPACVPESAPHIRLLYTLPMGQASNFANRQRFMLAGVMNANAILDANAQRFGVSMRWPLLCDANGVPVIDEVTLSTTAASTTFSSIASDVVNDGYTNDHEKVLVFHDGAWFACGCGGMSFIPSGSDAPGPSNPNDFGQGSISVVFLDNYGSSTWALDEVILHEETHAMGGVQLSAPHSSGAWHCNDGWDIMCYADHGSTSHYATSCFPAGEGDVGALMPYDCGNDDYFHPSPPAGSYLATHWNVGASYNRFIVRG